MVAAEEAESHMKRSVLFLTVWLSGAGVLCSALAVSKLIATVEWSNGRTLEGAISLTPGKDLRLFVGNQQTALRFEDIKELIFTPEKEEQRESFTFAEPGQAKQEKNGEIYPIRYLKTRVLFWNGKVLEGHLYTTVLYIETEEKTEKLVLLAKQTGKVGQKMEEVVYPQRIRLVPSVKTSGECQVDLWRADLKGVKSVRFYAKPDLTPLAARGYQGPAFYVGIGEPSRILYYVECEDAIRVAWPNENDAESKRAVEAALASSDMRDFYDDRTLLGCFMDGDSGDVYSLVLMIRREKTHSFKGDKLPWAISLLRWKYDAEEKKVTLLKRVDWFSGRVETDTPEHKAQPPRVLLDSKLLEYITFKTSKETKGGTP